MDFPKLSAGQRKSLETAAARYQAAMTPEAAAYLRSRGIEKDVADTSRLGCVVTPEVGHERFRGYLAIPTITRAGVVALRFRCIQDHDCRELNHGKYDAPVGQSTRLYNPSDLLKDSPVIALCEGEIDTITMSSLVGIPAVGLSGVAQWKKHHARLFVNHDRVFIIFDNDIPRDGKNPGQDAAKKIASKLTNATVVTLDVGEDINSVFLRDGAEAIRKRLDVESL